MVYENKREYMPKSLRYSAANNFSSSFLVSADEVPENGRMN
jgi:hypothetical protein